MSVVAHDGTRVKVALCRSTLEAGAHVYLGVIGSSMLPALWPGDIVEVCRWTAANLRVGAIVVFERECRLVVHRIAAVVEPARSMALLTRGDAQRTGDPPVALPEVLGVVASVRRLGARHIPRRRPRVAARGWSHVIRRSEWARRLSLRLYFFGTHQLAATRGSTHGD